MSERLWRAIGLMFFVVGGLALSQGLDIVDYRYFIAGIMAYFVGFFCRA